MQGGPEQSNRGDGVKVRIRVNNRVRYELRGRCGSMAWVRGQSGSISGPTVGSSQVGPVAVRVAVRVRWRILVSGRVVVIRTPGGCTSAIELLYCLGLRAGSRLQSRVGSRLGLLRGEGIGNCIMTTGRVRGSPNVMSIRKCTPIQ